MRKLELLEWLSHGREEDHPGAEKKTGYQIYQKNFESRRVLLIEADAPCKAEQLHRQICRQWRQLAAAEGYRMTGYLLDEKAFMEQKNLLLDGRFIMPETGEVNDTSVISMFPKGTYICMMTAVFRDNRWIRALSRY